MTYLQFILLIVLTSTVMSWTKCPPDSCKICDYKGCRLCLNQYSNKLYDCTDPTITNNATFCIHQATADKKCQVCQDGYYLDANSECKLLESAYCKYGIWDATFGIFRCTSCYNNTYVDDFGQCSKKLDTTEFPNCNSLNSTFDSNKTLLTCNQCDYGYALDENNICKRTCAEGCLKCLGNVCQICDYARGWWMTSPNNCTNKKFNYYKPDYGLSMKFVLSYLLAGIMAAMIYV